MIPNTFKECNEALDKLLKPDEQIKLKELSREKLIITHSTLGRQIRNSWKLWSEGSLYKHMIDKGFRHPDDMSGTIIKEYWLYLNGLPSEVEQDLIKYNKYWDELNLSEEG